MNFMNSIYLKKPNGFFAQCIKLKYGQQEQTTRFHSVWIYVYTNTPYTYVYYTPVEISKLNESALWTEKSHIQRGNSSINSHKPSWVPTLLAS